MANPGLIDFIRNAKSKGYSDILIRNTLLKKGWDSSQVDEAMKEGSEGIPVMSSKDKTTQPGQETKLSIWKNKILWAVIGSIALIFLIILAITSLSPNTECEVDRDCGSGYNCTDEECIEEEPECTEDDDCRSGYECLKEECSEIVVEEEPECIEDDDCDTDFECISEECIEIEETTSEDLEIISSTDDEILENYAMDSLEITSLDTNEALIDISYIYTTPDELTNSTQNVSLDCLIYEDQDFTEITSSSTTLSHDIISNTYTGNCSLDVSDLYSEFDEDLEYILFVSLDLDKVYTEDDETDNDLYLVTNWTLTDFEETSTTDDTTTTEECTSDSNCDSGYECNLTSFECEVYDATLIECINIDDCPTGYACDTNTELCSLDEDGNDIADSFEAATDDECTTETDSACSPYLCDTETYTCYTECSDLGTECSDGYDCNSEDGETYECTEEWTATYSEQPCERDSNCDYRRDEILGYKCDTTESLCFNSCSSNNECRADLGWSCDTNLNKCVADGILAEGSVCNDDAQCESGNCDSESKVPECIATDATPTESTAEKLLYGWGCSSNSDCASGICLSDTTCGCAVDGACRKNKECDTTRTSETYGECITTTSGSSKISKAPTIEVSILSKIYNFIFKVDITQIIRYFQ
ncbi:MAG: hypothetical protein Q8Q35_03800 [Nanoarchaeota archaeon]|nr:hypothetical protein [Nanoarchaeota archaeon]